MAMTLITTNTTSGTDEISAFTSGINSTYKLYIFKFYDVNPAVDDTTFQFSASTNGGSSYGITKTVSTFLSEHSEDDGTAQVAFRGGQDIGSGTGVAQLNRGLGNGGDESLAGELFLFNPSNTTYVKHFYSRTISYTGSNGADDFYAAGYLNTTSAINAVKFTCSTGDFDSVIKLYGVG